jgi:RND superfamily putative drug exporter
LAEGQTRDAALVRTMATAGRTVLFSAMTVALSMATMVLFPQYFLKSFAYAGVAVVAFAVAAAIIVAPAAIVLLSGRLDSLDVRRLVRRLLRRSELPPAPVERWFWYRWTKTVMREAVPIIVAVLAFLLLLGSPFHDVRWGVADDRVLPTSASARQVGDQLRNDFPGSGIPDVTVVLPNATDLSPAGLDGYAAALSRVPDVSSVSAPGGTFVNGTLAGPPSAPSGIKDRSAFVTVHSTAPLYSAASAAQLDRLHVVPTPAGRPMQPAGVAQSNRDTVHAIASRLHLALTGRSVRWCGCFRKDTSAGWVPRRPARWGWTCRCCCSASLLVFRWITSCSSSRESGSTGWPHTVAGAPTTRASRWAWPIPGG